MYRELEHSYKHRFPFRLSAPSFIYPADYITNVQRLAPFVDEIELLLFESAPQSLPTGEEVDRLKGLARQFDLSYNVHLPLDLNLGSRDTRHRQQAVLALTDILNRVKPLAPTTHTLHLTLAGYDAEDESAVASWQERSMQSLDALLANSRLAPRMISIETLSYPPLLFAPIADQLDTAVCVDVGHILRYGYNLETVLARYADRITILHLHGVFEGEDHLSLAQMPLRAMDTVKTFIARFTGSVSLEVFSFERLESSLAHLAKTMAVPSVE